MTLPVVCDASALVALLLDSGPDGEWTAGQVSGRSLLAPALVTFETANIIRRHDLAQLISADQAAQAHADLLELSMELWPYELLGPRVWELRRNLSAYDASYVAVAESAGAPLITLDRGIAGAPGLRCDVLVP